MPPLLRPHVMLAVGLATACGDDVGMASGSDDGGGSTTRGSSGADSAPPATSVTQGPGPSTGADVTGPQTTSTASTGADESTGPAPTCGDGVVDEGEGCDDDTPLCRTDCQLACSFAWTVPAIPSAVFLEVDVGPAGELIVVGSLLNGDVTDGSDVLVATLTPEGAVQDQWVRSFGDAQDAGAALAVVPDGSMYVAALSEQPGGDFEVELIRRNPDGSEAWVDAPIVAPFVFRRPLDVVALPGGGAALTTHQHLGGSDYDLWVGRYNVVGPVWSEAYTSVPLQQPSRDGGYMVVADGDGNISAGGIQPSDLGGFTVSDPVVVQYGTDGGPPNWTWTTWLNATNLDLVPVDAGVDPSGRTLFVYQQSHGAQASAHFVVFAFEPDGAMAWSFDSENLSIGAGQRAGAAAVDEAGRIFVIGASTGNGFPGDPLVVALEDGVELCARESDETPFDIAGATVDAAGNVVVAGIGFAGEVPNGTVGHVRGFDSR